MISGKTTIVIPVYNGGNYLRSAINTALTQTWRDIETIVVNDGSDDGGVTRDICLSYGERIRYFEKENGGVASALNLALKHMRGEYFSWLSHDDMYRPEKIERQIAALTAAGNPAGICFCDYDVVVEPSGIASPVKLGAIYLAERLVRDVYPLFSLLVHGCSLLAHRSHFERVGLFDESLACTQDVDMWFRMMRGRRQVYLPESLVVTRVHAESGSRTISSFADEVARFVYNGASSLAPDEVRGVFPSPSAFYAKIAGMLWGSGWMGEARLMAGRAEEEIGKEAGGEEKRAAFCRFLSGFVGRVLKDIHIFGCGVYGKRVFSDLTTRGISVAGFIDGDAGKWGTRYCGRPVLSPDAFNGEETSGTLIVVALRTPEVITEQLDAWTRAGYGVCLKQDLDAMLLETPPAMAGLRFLLSSGDR